MVCNAKLLVKVFEEFSADFKKPLPTFSFRNVINWDFQKEKVKNG